MCSSRVVYPQWLRSVFSTGNHGLPPPFLCPAMRHRPLSLAAGTAALARQHSTPTWSRQRRCLMTQTSNSMSGEASVRLDRPPTGTLPPQCPGCGAFSQTSNPSLPGFFNLTRNSIKKYLGLEVEEPPRRVREDDRVVQEALRHVDRTALDKLGIDLDGLWPEPGRPESEAATIGRDNPSYGGVLCSSC